MNESDLAALYFGTRPPDDSVGSARSQAGNAPHRTIDPLVLFVIAMLILVLATAGILIGVYQ